MALILDSFRGALSALRAVQTKSEDATLMAALDDIMRDAVRSGAIQHFEFTYELAWKFIKRRLELDLGRAAADGLSRRDLFRLAAENGLIADVQTWFGYHLARNETSHTYNAAVASRVYAQSLAFTADAAALLAVLEARNA